MWSWLGVGRLDRIGKDNKKIHQGGLVLFFRHLVHECEGLSVLPRGAFPVLTRHCGQFRAAPPIRCRLIPVRTCQLDLNTCDMLSDLSASGVLGCLLRGRLCPQCRDGFYYSSLLHRL